MFLSVFFFFFFFLLIISLLLNLFLILRDFEFSSHLSLLWKDVISS